MKNNNLLIIQPLLASYRKELFEDMTKYFDNVTVFADIKPKNGFNSPEKTKFDKYHSPILGNREKVYFQKNILTYVLKEKPSCIFITHDFRSITFWILLHLAKLLRIPIYGHGQGLYDKPIPSRIHNILFKYSIKLLTNYVCYTKSVKISLLNIGINSSKLSIMDNTIVNQFYIKPSEKKSINNYKLFYLGRLREGSNLEILFKAIKKLQDKGHEFSLELIGDGEKKQYLENLAISLNIDVVFHGKIYDNQQISEISKKSRYGVYPGDAGLSVVHYMSLSLIPLLHSDLISHMGPEPSYIINKQNGLTFDRGSVDSLVNVLSENTKDHNSQNVISQKAFETYKELTKISMSQKLINIIESNRK